MSKAQVIAFDPSQTFGVAWSDDGQVVPEHSAVWRLAHITDPGERYLELWERLKVTAYAHPTHVVWEDSRGHSGKSSEWFGGYRAHVQAWGALHGAEFMRVAPNTLKKWATGRGCATKAQVAANPYIEKDRMRSEALVRWPDYVDELSRIDENRIDALWALAWGLEQIHK